MVSRLFWNRKRITVKEDGLVQFQIRETIYQFQIYDPETFFTFQGSLAKIYYNEMDMSEIHLFDDNDRFYGRVEPRRVNDPGNPTIIEGHRRDRKKINAFANSQRKQWKQFNPGKDKAKIKKAKLPLEYHDFLITSESNSERDVYMTLNRI